MITSPDQGPFKIGALVRALSMEPSSEALGPPARRRRLATLAAACALAVMLALPAVVLGLPASALADTTVDFDGYAAGTTITTQYADLGGAGQGVTFGPLPGTGPAGLYPVVQTPPSGQAQSGANVGNIGVCFACEFYTPVTAGTFGVAHSHVSVRVGYLGAAAPCSDPDTDAGCAVVTLLAYDASGNQVAASSPATVTEGAGVHTLLSVSTPTASIVGFKVTARTDPIDDDKAIAIDDLTFDTPSTPPVPDFTLMPAQSVLSIVQGANVDDPIAIGRLGGSSGGVTLAVSGSLPPGLHAQFAPDPASGTQATLTLSADPDAPVTTGTNATVHVTGTPAGPTVGPDARSFDLSVAVAQAFDVSVPPATDVNLSSCTGSVPVTLTRDLRFTGPVSLSVTGLPPGVQASFSPSAQPSFPAGSGETTATLNLAAPASGQTLVARTATIHAVSPPLSERTATFTVGGTCPLEYDAQVTSIQITQGVQAPFLPVRDPLHPPSVTSYSEIPNAADLRANGPTVVRVYADLAFGPAAGVVNVPAVLQGYRINGVGSRVPLVGSPLLPTSPPRTLKPGPAQAGQDEEGSETAAYTFTLPPAWTHGTIGIVAQLLPAQGPTTPVATGASVGVGTEASAGTSPAAAAPCQTTACVNNDTMTLSQIPFYDSRSVRIYPLQLEGDGKPMPDPSSVFRWAQLVTPIPLSLEPYQATIDISDLKRAFDACVHDSSDSAAYVKCSDTANDAVSSRVDDWVCNNEDIATQSNAWVMGVNTGVARGLENPYDICWLHAAIYQDAVVEWQRPLTSVAHELFHLLGRPHASNCGGGGSNGQTAESWPPDQMGYTQSVGLDTILGSGLHGGPYAIASPPGQTWYDFMSYCANAGDTSSPLTFTPAPAWGSTHNWNAVMHAFGYLQNERAVARVASVPRASLQVRAFLYPDGTARIESVTPVRAPRPTVSGTGFRLVGLDAAGHQVVSEPLRVDPIHVDHETPPVELDGLIPARRVTSVELIGGGSVLARRSESPHAPTVSIGAAPVTRHGVATIRWRARDADRDPLLATIDYSRDGGRSWRPIWVGPSRDLVRVPARYLPRSRHARIRIAVSDGFRAASARSPLFRTPGAAPLVAILSPRRDATVRDDAPLVLHGQAFDDQGRVLKGRRLHWLLGKRPLGSGAEISTGLAPGSERIVLVARDRYGRTARARLTVHVQAARPLFLTLSAPHRIGLRARRVTLAVRSSLAARLVVALGGRARPQRYEVSRRLRRLRLRIRRGSRPLQLRLTLSTGRLRSRAMVVIVRR